MQRECMQHASILASAVAVPNGDPSAAVARPGERRYVDDGPPHTLRMPSGYREAKDDKDDLGAGIDLRVKRGYPRDKIIFDDSIAVLIQNAREVTRLAIDDINDREGLGLFFGCQRRRDCRVDASRSLVILINNRD